MTGESSGDGQHDMLRLVEQDMDLQERLHGATLAVCDLAFKLAGQRADFNTRFTELGYTTDGTNMDHWYLTYDLPHGETLQVKSEAPYRLTFRDAEGHERSRQTLRAEPIGADNMPEFVEANRPASTMTVADMFTAMGVMATSEPRPPRDEEL